MASCCERLNAQVRSAHLNGVVMTFIDGLRALVDGQVQARLAEEVGVHRSAVSQWLAGASRPTPGNLEALMRAVGAPEPQRAAMRTLYFTGVPPEERGA